MPQNADSHTLLLTGFCKCFYSLECHFLHHLIDADNLLFFLTKIRISKTYYMLTTCQTLFKACDTTLLIKPSYSQ